MENWMLPNKRINKEYQQLRRTFVDARHQKFG